MTVLNCDGCNANADKIRCLSMRAPKRRPGLNIREYLGPVIVGSVALFSLLVTNQLVWRAFNSLSARISGPFIWVTPDPSIVQTKDGPPHALQGNVYFQLVAPPGSQVRTNQDYLPGPSIMITSRIGRTSFGFHLHRGSNEVGFMLGGDVASPSGYWSQTFEYHASDSVPPVFVAAWRERGSLHVLGFAEPDTTLILHLNGQMNAAHVDSAGSFVEALALPSAESTGTQKLTAQYVDVNAQKSSPAADAVEVTDSPRQYFHGAGLDIDPQAYNFAIR